MSKLSLIKNRWNAVLNSTAVGFTCDISGVIVGLVSCVTLVALALPYPFSQFGNYIDEVERKYKPKTPAGQSAFYGAISLFGGFASYRLLRRGHRTYMNRIQKL